MQEAQYDFLHGQTDRSDFFSPAMQQLCGIMKDNQVALPSDIGEGYFRYISPCPNIEMYICDVMFYRDTVLREQVYKDSFSVIFSLSDALEWKSSGRAEIYRRRAEPASLSVSVCDGWFAEEKGLHRL